MKETSDDRRIALERKLKAKGRKMPLDFLTFVYSNRKLSWDRRIDAAKACLPYFHKKQPIALESEGDVQVILPFIPTREQIDKELTLLEKADGKEK